MADSRKNCGSQNFGRSTRGLTWKVTEPNERSVLNIAQKLAIPEILATILCNRGIDNAEEAELFLSPKIRSYMPNPFDLLDMEKASLRIAKGIMSGEKIAIFGDYDVDGATSTALLKRFFASVDCDVTVYIPNRITEGYGPNIEAFKKLKDQGNTLIITVDCGMVSFEPIAYASEIGLDVIVLDHHLSLDVFPKAYAIVNPNRCDETFPHKSIAAVGVAFFTSVAIRSKLRELSFFETRAEPDNIQLLDLVALGTICDVMHLSGINRAFVAQGLKLINSRQNVGLATLGNVANLDSTIQSYHLGFILGPRINAGGRIGEGLLGSELLSTNDAGLAMEISLKLERLNDERRAIETVILESAINRIEQNKLYENPIIIISDSGWHQGILGIIASRLKEKYSKPCAVISFDNGDAGKGSARSIPGIDMGSLLAQAKSTGLLLQGGGHPMAGGFSVARDKLDEFCRYVYKILGNTDLLSLKIKDVAIDYILSLPAINGSLLAIINRAAPFGSGNNQPKFMIKEVTIVDARIVGKFHIMFIVCDKKSDVSCTVKCMMFKVVDTEIGNALLNAVGKTVCVIGTLQAHYLDCNKADFIAEDISFYQ